MQGNNVRFSELLELHINSVIKRKFARRSEKDQLILTPELMREVRDTIREHVTAVFSKSSHKLTDNALLWLTNKYFVALQINDDQTMGDLVVVNENKLSDLPYHDIELLRNLFNETALAEPLEEEYSRRSAS